MPSLFSRSGNNHLGVPRTNKPPDSFYVVYVETLSIELKKISLVHDKYKLEQGRIMDSSPRTSVELGPIG